jgi:AcrR family transcriptional regulator
MEPLVPGQPLGLAGREPARRPGRPKGNTAEATRERILDAAEALFAEGGYDGASMRDVALGAGVKLAVITYHFGLKDQLFEAVVERRASVMNTRRIRHLTEAVEAAGGDAVAPADLIRGYVSPFFEMAQHGDAGWRNYATLMGRLSNSPRGTDVISRHYDNVARAYLAEFRRALPGVSEAAVVDGFMVMVSAMLSICAGTGRAERLMRRPVSTGTPATTFDDLIRFVAGGFAAIADDAACEP